MKNTFKPVGIAAAVAAVTAGYAQAQPAVSNNNFGDLALVPYYTVNEGFVTGVHIINSSDATQVVKVRLRRGADSMDALDFNLVLSPEDMWVGFINEEDNGQITFNTQDTSCTAPATANGRFVMPEIYREGAEEGYIEVIGMGEIDVSSPIGIASKHKAGTPADCAGVRSNFFSIGSAYPGTAGSPAARGIINFETTHQAVADAASFPGATCVNSAGDVITKGAGFCVNTFRDSSDALKVSYFIRDNDSGVEFGGEAFHIAGFLGEAAMSNQQGGLSSGDLSGFDYPDLNGGAIDGATRDAFNALRQNDVLGALAVANDWSANSANGVSTDWVLTMPGQYTMLDLATYTDGFDTTGVTGAEDCVDQSATNTPACDNRDIPVVIDLNIFDREEGSFTPDPGDLVVSPQPPAENPQFTLDREVNVIQWNGSTGVLASQEPTEVDSSLNPLDANFGWANVSVASTARTPAVCDLQDYFNATGFTNGDAIAQGSVSSTGVWSEGDYTCTSVDGAVPVIGIVAWERQVAANPNASYGRIVEHAYVTNS
jgi:hypothetical protein